MAHGPTYYSICVHFQYRSQSRWHSDHVLNYHSMHPNLNEQTTIRPLAPLSAVIGTLSLQTSWATEPRQGQECDGFLYQNRTRTFSVKLFNHKCMRSHPHTHAEFLWSKAWMQQSIGKHHQRFRCIYCGWNDHRLNLKHEIWIRLCLLPFGNVAWVTMHLRRGVASICTTLPWRVHTVRIRRPT